MPLAGLKYKKLIGKLQTENYFQTPADVIVFRKGNLAIAVKGDTKETIASSTDHAEVIQAAINYLKSQGGGKLFIASGDYLLNKPLVIKQGGIILYGGGATRLISNGSNIISIEYEEGTGGIAFITITDMRLDGGNNNVRAITNENSPGDAWTRDIIIERLQIVNLNGSDAIGIYLEGPERVRIRDCFINEVKKGIAFKSAPGYAGGNIWIENNYIGIYDQPDAVGIEHVVDVDGNSRHIIILNNHILGSTEYSETGVRIAHLAGGEISYIKILNNRFEHVDKPILFEGTVRYSHIVANTIAQWKSGDIKLISLPQKSAGTVIAHNYIEGASGNTGIHSDIWESPKNIIFGNIFRNVEKPIEIPRPQFAIIKNNINYLTENSGVATLSGDGSTTDFLIGEHGLSPSITDPSKVIVKVTPASPDAIAASPCVGYLSDEEPDGVYESIRVKFASAPASGTDNVKVVWEVEYIG